MKRYLKYALALLAVVLIGATALAHNGMHNRGEFMKRHVSARIDEALTLAKATDAQRATIYAARDHVFAAFANGHHDRGADFAEALTLFEADQLDHAKVDAMRAAHQAEAKAAGDAIVQALTEAHDTLTPVQRRAIADWARSHPQEEHARMAGFMKGRVTSHIDDLLTEVKATPEQKTAVHAALEHVFATFSETHGDMAKQKERALAVFTSDKLDPAAVQALRDQHQAEQTKVGDAIAQAISDVHDALTSAQRKQAVAWVRAHHPEHMQHMQHMENGQHGG